MSRYLARSRINDCVGARGGLHVHDLEVVPPPNRSGNGRCCGLDGGNTTDVAAHGGGHGGGDGVGPQPKAGFGCGFGDDGGVADFAVGSAAAHADCVILVTKGRL